MIYYAIRVLDDSKGEGYKGSNLHLNVFSTLENLNSWLNCNSIDGFLAGERKRITLKEAIRIFSAELVEFNKKYIDSQTRN